MILIGGFFAVVVLFAVWTFCVFKVFGYINDFENDLENEVEKRSEQ